MDPLSHVDVEANTRNPPAATEEWNVPRPSTLPEWAQSNQHNFEPVSDETVTEKSIMNSIIPHMRLLCLHFSPIWFSITMGTGVVALLLQNIPYRFNGLDILAKIVFALNLLFFVLFIIISMIRYIAWPQVFWLMIYDPSHSMFLGCVSMGFATLINMCVLGFDAEGRGGAFHLFVWVLWWINTAFSIWICAGITFVMATRHNHELKGVTSVLILPIVSVVVDAASGAIVSDVLPVSAAKITIVVSYLILGAGMGTTVLIMTLYYARLIFHKVPNAKLIVSVFLPLGPCAQGAYAFMHLATSIQKLGKDAGQSLVGGDVLSQEDAHIMNLGIVGVSLLSGLFLWGFAFFWLILAIAMWIDVWWVAKIKFNLSWWGCTFPIGVYGLATMEVGQVMDSGSFRILGIVITLCVIVLWLFVSLRTLWFLCRGKMYVSKLNLTLASLILALVKRVFHLNLYNPVNTASYPVAKTWLGPS